jgi:hypothetical protein
MHWVDPSLRISCWIRLFDALMVFRNDSQSGLLDTAAPTTTVPYLTINFDPSLAIRSLEAEAGFSDLLLGR